MQVINVQVSFLNTSDRVKVFRRELDH